MFEDEKVSVTQIDPAFFLFQLRGKRDICRREIKSTYPQAPLKDTEM